MKRLLVFMMGGVALFSSCKKDDKSSGSTSATFSAIADKKWQLTAYSMTYMGSKTDAYDLMSSCSRDNLWTMRSDKTNLLDEGATKCSSSDPQTKVEGTWELRSGDKEIYLKGFSSTGATGITDMTLTIVEISATTLKVKYTTTVNGPVIENEATYTAR